MAITSTMTKKTFPKGRVTIIEDHTNCPDFAVDLATSFKDARTMVIDAPAKEGRLFYSRHVTHLTHMITASANCLDAVVVSFQYDSDAEVKYLMEHLAPLPAHNCAVILIMSTAALKMARLRYHKLQVVEYQAEMKNKTHKIT